MKTRINRVNIEDVTAETVLAQLKTIFHDNPGCFQSFCMPGGRKYVFEEDPDRLGADRTHGAVVELGIQQYVDANFMRTFYLSIATVRRYEHSGFDTEKRTVNVSKFSNQSPELYPEVKMLYKEMEECRKHS
jgi:hypothetical protein